MSTTQTQKPVYTTLTDVVIVDLKAYRTASVEVMQAINDLSKKYTIEYVDDMSKYKNKNVIFSDVVDGKYKMSQIEFFIGRAPTTEEVQTIEALSKVKAQFESLMYKPVPNYTFIDVPSNQTLDTQLKFKKDRIYRNGYTMGYKTAERVWTVARDYWFACDADVHENDRPTRYLNVAASGYNKNVTVYADRVEIGCQTVPRWVVEQLAIKQGWATQNT